MVLNQILLGMFGGQEIIVILLIVLILFGGAKIPELMRGLGKGMNEFKKAKEGLYDEEPNNNNSSDQNKKKSDQASEKS